jgi:hypothetical protein
VGVALAALISLCCVVSVNNRLLQERAALEKDKSGGALYKFWNRIVGATGAGGNKRENYKYKQVELSDKPLFSSTVYDDVSLAADDINDNT